MKLFSKKIEIDTNIIVGEIDNINLIDNLIQDIKTKIPLSKI